MIALFTLYWPTIIAAALCAAALSIAGAFLITRQAGVQILAVSQGAGFGVSGGLLLTMLFAQDNHIAHTMLPLAIGLATSAASFAFTQWVAGKSHSPNAVYLSAFALFWGMSQIFSGFFPAVENHASAIFFGDLVTLTRGESLFFMALSSWSLFYLIYSQRLQTERAFLSSILGEPIRLSNLADLGFYLTALLLICFSVQLLGLLFTISALFVPTSIFSYSMQAGVARHLRRISLSAALATIIGFSLSLWEPRLLTTPLITLFLAFLPLLSSLADFFIFRCKWIATKV